MEIEFLGAAQTVTGSKYLLHVDQRQWLVDCGLFQGFKELRLRNWHPLSVAPKDIEGVILTHAHIDHSGYIPLLVKNGFRGPIYTTAATRALCNILLPDSGYLQEEDAAFANKHHFSKHHPALPLYTEQDGRTCLQYFKDVSWDQKISLSPDVSALFQPAGHILGASTVQLFVGGKKITFSGDLGRQKTLTLNPPKPVLETDYLVVESTYGNKIHPQEDPKESLKKVIEKTIQRKGIVLIPSFAVGRAQQILLLLSQLKKEGALAGIPIFVNSPMAVEATRVFCQFDAEQALTTKEGQELFNTARFITTVEESKSLNHLKMPAIIIAASGMATGGRVLHHLKSLASHPNNTVLFAGFQAPGTRGEALLKGAKTIRIHGEDIPVRAEVLVLDSLSAHADQEEILTWLQYFSKPPKLTFITHGEPTAGEALKKKIEETLHWKCVYPRYLERTLLG